ncbi:MAG: LysM peptidoglycan-binding domain-containing protein [Victivallales bacterium]|nr:LysM peptidoglycan-binding domain-containing protein [Victivallales bacterium]
MKKIVFLLLCLALAFSVNAQQQPAQQRNAAALLQQALAVAAGLQADVNMLKDETTRLNLRIEALEQELAERDQKIARLESLCAAQSNQMQAQEKQWNNRITALQNAMEADRQNIQKQLQQLSKDLSKDLAAAVKAATPSPQSTKTSTPKYTGQTRDFKVESGDTLGSIAKALGCTVQDLVELNNLKSADAIIRVGQILKVPSK